LQLLGRCFASGDRHHAVCGFAMPSLTLITVGYGITVPKTVKSLHFEIFWTILLLGLGNSTKFVWFMDAHMLKRHYQFLVTSVYCNQIFL